MPVMSTVMYSPRLFLSRIESVLMSPYYAKNPALRGEILREAGSVLAFGGAVIGTAKAFGARYETDPRSSEVGKLIVGNTRISVWSGYEQYLRLVAQLVTGKQKNIDQTVSDKLPFETVKRFFWAKSSPLASFIMDVLNKRTYMGQPVFDTSTISSQLGNKIAPFTLQAIMEAVYVDPWGNPLDAQVQENWPSQLGASVPNILGINTSTYSVAPKAPSVNPASIGTQQGTGLGVPRSKSPMGVPNLGRR
jgi:hypothetical protein